MYVDSNFEILNLIFIDLIFEIQMTFPYCKNENQFLYRYSWVYFRMNVYYETIGILLNYVL